MVCGRGGHFVGVVERGEAQAWKDSFRPRHVRCLTGTGTIKRVRSSARTMGNFEETRTVVAGKDC